MAEWMIYISLLFIYKHALSTHVSHSRCVCELTFRGLIDTELFDNTPMHGASMCLPVWSHISKRYKWHAKWLSFKSTIVWCQYKIWFWLKVMSLWYSKTLFYLENFIWCEPHNIGLYLLQRYVLYIKATTLECLGYLLDIYF